MVILGLFFTTWCPGEHQLKPLCRVAIEKDHRWGECEGQLFENPPKKTRVFSALRITTRSGEIWHGCNRNVFHVVMLALRHLNAAIRASRPPPPPKTKTNRNDYRVRKKNKTI